MAVWEIRFLIEDDPDERAIRADFDNLEPGYGPAIGVMHKAVREALASPGGQLYQGQLVIRKAEPVDD